MKIIFLITAFTFCIHGHSQSPGTTINLNSPGETRMSFNTPELINNDNSNGKIDISAYYLPGLSIGGAELNLGAEVFLFEESSWMNEGDLPDGTIFDVRRDYGDKKTPIISNPESEIPFNLDIGYTHDNTRIGLSWFRMTASYEQSGEMPGLDFYIEDETEGFGYGFVSFWNMGWDLHVSRNFPASWVEGFADHGEIEGYDEIEEVNYDTEFFPDKGKTEWEVAHDISFNSFQLTVQHSVIKNESLNLNLVGGLQYGRWSDNLKQSMNITAHRELTDRWIQMLEIDEEAEDSIMVEVFWDDIFHNDITLKTSSSSEFNSFGLLAGIEAEWKVLPSLSFSVKAGGSTLSGDASYSGTGIDIDDIVESDIITLYDMEGNLLLSDPLEGYEYLSGEFELPEYSRSILSVNYHLSISARYEITGNISVMAGYYYSLWKDLPMSPQWSYSDEFTRPYGPFAVEESWDKDRKANISASGFMLGAGFRF